MDKLIEGFMGFAFVPIAIIVLFLMIVFIRFVIPFILPTILICVGGAIIRAGAGSDEAGLIGLGVFVVVVGIAWLGFIIYMIKEEGLDY